MSTKDLKFFEYPFSLPSEKKIRAKFEKLLTEIKECGSAKTAAVAIKHWNKYSDEIETLFSVIYVLYSCDTTNLKYKKAQDICDELSPIISNYSNEYHKILVKARYRKDLEKTYGSYLFKMYDNSLKSFDEKIMNDLVEENKLVSKYDAIFGSAQIPFRGEILNTSQIGKHLQSKDRNERKEAALAYDNWLAEKDAEIGEIYSKLVVLRNGMANKLGFKNFVDLAYLRLGRTDYDSKKVKKYRDQISADVVPLCQKLYKQQIKLLGIKNPQYYDYNLRYPTGNAKPAGDKNYLVNVANEMYSNLSVETKVFFEFMNQHELMDLEARKGKAPGGYCTYFPNYKSPFIFSNFNGTEGDVNVLTHEGGHAFQAYMCSNMKTPEFRSPTLESCEIHSMSMEFLAWPYMDKFFGEDADKSKYTHLVDAIEFLPYGASIDEFQHWVYEHPNATHEERCQFYKSLEAKYVPHKKYDGLKALSEGRTWIRQSHVFGVPFYYIDYTLAQVVAFQFLLEDRKNHEKAWKKYLKVCKCGGKYPFCELLEKNHIKNPFDEGTLKKVMSSLKKILNEFTPEKY